MESVPAMGPSKLLCLKCREEGHVLSDCSEPHFQRELDWLFSNVRMSMDFRSAWDSQDHQLCQRCNDLQLLQLLGSFPPWQSHSQLTEAVEKESKPIVKLGTTGTIQFQADCAMCRCLFALTPNPTNAGQEVLIVPYWTITHLSGADGIVGGIDEELKSATMFVVLLKPSFAGVSIPDLVHRSDAMCLMTEDLEPERCLGARRIRAGDHIDLARAWIEACSTRHLSSCTPKRMPELDGVRLLDVTTRQIVAMPSDCETEYVALSYVWGDVPSRSFKLGSILVNVRLPSTIEDAIRFTAQLDKKYLWTDYVCINQADTHDKNDQIKRMWAIYRGAIVTLLAMSGESANAPMLRHDDTEPQLTCCVGGKRLVGLMPTLSHQIWECRWGKRAWTLQEALLSQRCIYFSDHQMYFECNVMQVIESLDESSSARHQLCHASAPEDTSFINWMAQKVGPGCLRSATENDSRSERITHYGRKVTLYSYRKLTDPRDGLNAFNGVLQRLEDLYPKGYYGGLPIEDFDWALLWRSRYPQKNPLRRVGFPSWTWASLEGGIGVWHGEPVDVTKPRRFPIHLIIQKAAEARLVRIFETHPGQPADDGGVSINVLNDPLENPWGSEAVGPPFDLVTCTDAEEKKYLFVEAIVFPLDLTSFKKTMKWKLGFGEEIYLPVAIGGADCRLGIMSVDSEITEPAEPPRNCVLIARDHIHGFIIHYLLLLRQRQDRMVAERGTVLQLLVPLNQLEVLQELRPRKERVILA